jgi:hypothetical protein
MARVDTPASDPDIATASSFTGSKPAAATAAVDAPVQAPLAPPTRDDGLKGFAILPPGGGGTFLLDLFAALLAALVLTAPQFARVFRGRPRAFSAAALRHLLERPG